MAARSSALKRCRNSCDCAICSWEARPPPPTQRERSHVRQVSDLKSENSRHSKNFRLRKMSQIVTERLIVITSQATSLEIRFLQAVTFLCGVVESHRGALVEDVRHFVCQVKDLRRRSYSRVWHRRTAAGSHGFGICNVPDGGRGIRTSLTGSGKREWFRDTNSMDQKDSIRDMAPPSCALIGAKIRS